jgi:hypothetical protein
VSSPQVKDPQVDVAAYIITLGLSYEGVALALGTNLFRGEVQAVGNGVPSAAIFVQALTGDPPEGFLGAEDEWTVEVEVTVRSNPGQREDARAFARGLLARLHRAPITGYTLVVAEDSEPEWVEADESDCHEYTFSITVEWEG